MLKEQENLLVLYRKVLYHITENNDVYIASTFINGSKVG